MPADSSIAASRHRRTAAQHDEDLLELAQVDGGLDDGNLGQLARRGLHFGDHAAERPVAQRVLTHREQFLVIPALRIEDALWPKPRLFEPRGVKIETRQRPESRKSRRRRETRGDPGDEQGQIGRAHV